MEDHRQIQTDFIEMLPNAMGVDYSTSNVQLHCEIATRHHAVGPSQGER